MVDISILMPCYNEGKYIRKNIFETVNTLKKKNNGSFELIVIDDGSRDKTYQEIKTAAQENGYVKTVQLKQNMGKGCALREGFQYAEGKYICFLDGDLDIHPRLIKSLLTHMNKENADVVIGSKRHALSKVNYPLHRKILSLGYQLFIKILFQLSIMDSQVGIKIFKKEVLDKIFPLILVKEYAFDIELLVNAHRNGYKIIEAPIEMDFQSAGISSEVSPDEYIKMFKDTCAIFYRTNILHYYDNIYTPSKIDTPILTKKSKIMKNKSKFVNDVKYMQYETPDEVNINLNKNIIKSDELISKMNLKNRILSKNNR
jgi:glycosyltransferase involved in cell wall biosynthesis